eukprot:3676829-Rhodomonas_salina.1
MSRVLNSSCHVPSPDLVRVHIVAMLCSAWMCRVMGRVVWGYCGSARESLAASVVSERGVHVAAAKVLLDDGKEGEGGRGGRGGRDEVR